MKHYEIDIRPEFLDYIGGLANVGQTVFLRLWINHHHFVVPAIIREVTLVLVRKDQTGNSHWWHIRDDLTEEEKVEACYGPPENPEKWEIFSQWIWTDEPVGHELTLNDRYDDVYTNFQTALQSCTPWKGAEHHRVKKLLREYRKRCWKFIIHTHEMNGEINLIQPLQADKQVFVRRK